MRSVLLVLACCLLAGPVLAEQPPLSDDVLFAEDANGLRPEDPAWSPDGRSLAYLWGQDELRDEKPALWRLDVTTGKSERLSDLDLDEYVWSPRGDALLLVSEGDLYLLPLGGIGGGLRRLTETKEEETQPGFSPDGSRLAFVRGFDLHVLDLATGRETALTQDGEENVFLNGTTDWVYWEEIWDREASGFWWSPDSRSLAYYRFDEREVPAHALLDEIPRTPAVRWQKYPKPGEPNPKVRIGVIPAAGGKTVWMDTGNEDGYLTRVAWTGGAVAIQRLNRDQTRLDLLRCNTADGACSTLLTETRPTWINLGNDLHFLDDGRFVWGSEGDGWRRLYLHDRDGKLVRPITPEGWGIASLEGVVDGGAIVTAYRTEGMGPADRAVYRAGLDRESWEPLAAEPGTHEAVVASNGSWVHTWHDADTPPRSEVRTASGTVALPWTAPAGYNPATLPKWEFLFIPGPQGVRLPARMLKPAGFDPSRRYPALMYHYGGPASQVVLNRWDARRRDLWQKKMAQRGFAILNLDNASSIFFGKTGEDRDHRRFGPANLEAQLAGVEYLKGLGWVDPARIGLWGWSGGGYHTLYALLHAPGVWKAGMAGAPVTDWNLYDSIWTERYLDTPESNPDGYRDSSVTTDAEKLKDHLLIVHGFADDNVHPQNTVVFIDKLIQAGIPYEDAFYPGQKHAFQGAATRHWYARMTEFFERMLR
ncbi:MAG: DPP IV N-terminal domain-containing protein [Thermoanaerobaculia bacterium]